MDEKIVYGSMPYQEQSMNEKAILKRETELVRIDGEIVTQKTVTILQDVNTGETEKVTEVNTRSDAWGLPILSNKAAKASNGKLIILNSHHICIGCGIPLAPATCYTFRDDEGRLHPLCEKCSRIMISCGNVRKQQELPESSNESAAQSFPSANIEEDD